MTGRNFRCAQCSKSYLSYPALYTHSKTKHSADPSSARSGRGRPPKPSEALAAKMYREFFKLPERQGSTHEPLKVLLKAIVKLDKKIGWGLYTPEEHPLVQAIHSQKSTCDHAFANYCLHAAKLANEVFFEKLCAVVLGYRECLNKYGWQKLAEEQHEDAKHESSGSDSPRVSGECAGRRKSGGKDYAASSGAERLPEVANEFVLLFAKEHDLGVPENEVIDITMNMCEWIFENKYSKTQLAFI